MDEAQLAEKRISVASLLNDKILCSQSGLCYHYPSQLLYSNHGQLRSIVLAIMDLAEHAQKRTCADFFLND